MVVPARDEAGGGPFAPELDLGGAFVGVGGAVRGPGGAGGRFCGKVQSAAGEDQLVREGEGGHEGLGGGGVVEGEGGGGGEFVAVGELRRVRCGREVEFVDVGGDVGCLVEVGKADLQR